MVGVSGRSKGCNTCRQRKIACGLQRPVCHQCAKSSRACNYNRHNVFISVNPARKNGASDVDTITVTGNRQLVDSAYRQQLIDSCMSQWFIPKRILGMSKTWPMMILELSMETKALQVSSLALSTAVLGRSSNNLRFVHESGKLYVQSLVELQKALWSPRLAYNDETLAVCLILALYELMECPLQEPDGYANHCKGLLALVQQRGPHFHVTGLGHQLFLGMRFQGIVYAIQNRSSTYLAEADWMQVPWAESPKRPIDRIADCLAYAAETLKEGERLQYLSPAERLILANKLVSQCWDFDWMLQECYQAIQLTADGPLYWPTLSRGKDPMGVIGAGKLFPVAYEFPNVMTASTLMMYWASAVMLWSGLCHLYQLIDDIVNHESTEGYRSHDLPPLKHRTDFYSVAWHVCRSVEYCMGEEREILGRLVVSTPLGIVVASLRDLPHCQQEVTWIRAALDHVRSKGLRILKYVQL